MEIPFDFEGTYPNMIKNALGYPLYPLADTLSTLFVELLLLISFRGSLLRLLEQIEGRLRSRK